MFRQKKENDVEFPSECCEYILLPFVSKKAAFAYGWAEYSQAGRDRDNRQSRRKHVAAEEETHWNIIW